MTCCWYLWLFLTAEMQILRGPLEALADDNPCPSVFHYEGSTGNEYGVIMVPNPYPYLAIDIIVSMYITDSIPKNSVTKLEPGDKNVWRKLAAGSRDPVLYRLDFPVSTPLPTINSITVNQNVICRGTKPNANYLTTVTVQHTMFNDKCGSASLECPFNNIQQYPARSQPPPATPPPSPPRANTDSSSATSPCPDVFKYELDSSGAWHAIISVPNPYPVVAIDIQVELYATGLTSNRNGDLELVNNLVEEWERMRTGERYFIQYRINFPMRSPLPTVKKIIVNNQQICTGSKPNSPAFTVLSFQHGLFNQKCTSASLDCPYNTVEGVLPVAPQYPTFKPPTTQRPLPPPPPPTTPKPEQTPIQVKPDTGRCGLPVERTNPLVVGGQKTEHGRWPWHAAVYQHQGFNTVYRCGGSFVGTKTIITAAHCVTTMNGEAMAVKDVTVFLGRYDLTNHREKGAQQRDVLKIFVHSEYNTTIYLSDIAMLILSTTVEYTVLVRPVCLWNPSDTSIDTIIGKEGVVVGWGLDEFGKTEDTLKLVNMPVVSRTTCLSSNIGFYLIFAHETTFCAGFRNDSSVCNGDSGGGMVFPENQGGRQIWRLRGIVSNSMPDEDNNQRCNSKNYIIFTDIAQYMEWIQFRLI